MRAGNAHVEDLNIVGGIAADAMTRLTVDIRGHEERVDVRTEVDPTVVASYLDPQYGDQEPDPADPDLQR